MFVDWSHTVKPCRCPRSSDEPAACRTACSSTACHPGCGSLTTAPAAAGLPVVTTCYGSSPAGIAEAAARASAYLYLVASYGRSGRSPASGFAALAETVAELRAAKTAPVAVGFGVRTAVDVAAVHDLGADAAVVGTATVDRVERAGRRARRGR